MGRYDQAGMFGDVFGVYVTQTNIDIIWGDDEQLMNDNGENEC